MVCSIRYCSYSKTIQLDEAFPITIDKSFSHNSVSQPCFVIGKTPCYYLLVVKYRTTFVNIKITNCSPTAPLTSVPVNQYVSIQISKKSHGNRPQIMQDKYLYVASFKQIKNMSCFHERLNRIDSYTRSQFKIVKMK